MIKPLIAWTTWTEGDWVVIDLHFKQTESAMSDRIRSIRQFVRLEDKCFCNPRHWQSRIRQGFSADISGACSEPWVSYCAISSSMRLCKQAWICMSRSKTEGKQRWVILCWRITYWDWQNSDTWYNLVLIRTNWRSNTRIIYRFLWLQFGNIIRSDWKLVQDNAIKRMIHLWGEQRNMTGEAGWWNNGQN